MNYSKEELIDIVEAGISGKSIWASTGMNTMEEDGIRIFPSCFTLIGGNPGTGKSAFFHEAYIHNPYDWWIDKKKKGETDVELYWLLWSMERPLAETKLKWIARKIFIDSFNKNKSKPILWDIQFLKGFKSSKVTEDEKKLVYKTFDYFEEMFDYMEIHCGTANPIGILNDVTKYAETIGSIVKTPYTTKDGITRNTTKYIKKNPNRITIIGIDHIGKIGGCTIEGKYLAPESRELLGKMYDLVSQIFRDRYGFSPVVVSQFNRSLENTNRFGNTPANPQPSDFKNASNGFEDGDIVLALFNPFKLGITSYAGYDLLALRSANGSNRSRMLVTLKNSYGLDDKGYGMAFFGEIGHMMPLPKSDSITEKEYKYYRDL